MGAFLLECQHFPVPLTRSPYVAACGGMGRAVVTDVQASSLLSAYGVVPAP